MRRTLVVSLWVTALAGAASLGCGRDPSRRSGPVGVLTGRVRLADGAGMPEYAAFDLGRRPLHEAGSEAEPASCAAANQAARHPVQLTADRALSGIVVAASDFTRMRARDPVVHPVQIHRCRLQPPLIAAQGGDLLELRNDDAFPFRPMLGPSYAARILPPGSKVRVPLRPGTVDSILCSRGAPCGRTDLVVFYHPVYAVTDARGEFRIPNFPAAELVRVSAWHPLFEESQTFVWLEPGERGHAELLLTPKRRFLPSSAQAGASPGSEARPR